MSCTRHLYADKPEIQLCTQCKTDAINDGYHPDLHACEECYFHDTNCSDCVIAELNNHSQIQVEATVEAAIEEYEEEISPELEARIQIPSSIPRFTPNIAGIETTPAAINPTATTAGTINCHNCGRFAALDRRQQVQQRAFPGTDTRPEIWCGDCFENSFVCDSCGVRDIEDQRYNYGDETLCSDCFHEN